MNQQNAILAAWLCLALAGTVGCGQKGALYLPDHNGSVVTRPGGGSQNSGAPQPATQQPAETPKTDSTPADTTKKDTDNKDGSAAQK